LFRSKRRRILNFSAFPFFSVAQPHYVGIRSPFLIGGFHTDASAAMLAIHCAHIGYEPPNTSSCAKKVARQRFRLTDCRPIHLAPNTSFDMSTFSREVAPTTGQCMYIGIVAHVQGCRGCAAGPNGSVVRAGARKRPYRGGAECTGPRRLRRRRSARENFAIDRNMTLQRCKSAKTAGTAVNTRRWEHYGNAFRVGGRNGHEAARVKRFTPASPSPMPPRSPGWPPGPLVRPLIQSVHIPTAGMGPPATSAQGGTFRTRRSEERSNERVRNDTGRVSRCCGSGRA
jgi:hypothetical protein